ncbi:MAG TPA: VOC family protein [Chloroflexota bacterium]|jgi:catechol 2,3-dioxygenase-like lactoylglutathione lyase family enzyme
MAKLRHIAISTEDPEKTAAWYKEVFGLVEVGKSPVGVYLSDGDINFAVLRIPSPDHPDQALRGVNHFGFMVEAPEIAYQKLAELGAQRLPDIPLAGQYVEVRYEGPDGISIDISEHGWVGAKPLEPSTD